jgi:hypothetical protein
MLLWCCARRPVIRPGAGVGIGNAGEVHIPLDRRAALSMSGGSTGDLRVRGVTKTAVFLNDATARNARRYLFHHPEDDPLRGLRLPALQTPPGSSKTCSASEMKRGR